MLLLCAILLGCGATEDNDQPSIKDHEEPGSSSKEKDIEEQKAQENHQEELLEAGDWKYSHQWDFYSEQIQKGKTDVTNDTVLFFNEYFRSNRMELWLLPDFSPEKAPDWFDLSRYIISNASSEDWLDGSMTKEDFDKYMTRYFGDVSYTPEPNTGLIYEDGKFTYPYGFSYHGSILYELTKLEKGKTKDGRDKWKAHIKGYYFHEFDGVSEDDEFQSKNARVVWDEMKKEEHKGLDFQQVKTRLLLNDPGSKLDLSSEWTIEFTINDPMGDIYFTYLSCESKWYEDS